ncbi:MAG TPA: hypothetical protein VF925_11155 [Casimicrobiaceae bacterium]
MTGSSTPTRVVVAWLAAAALAGVDHRVAAQSPGAAVATAHIAAGTGTPTTAPPPHVTHAAALAAGCTPCHQAQMHGVPALDGQTQEALRAKLEAFRDGTLSGTVMPQLVRGYTPTELDLIAGWFAGGGDSR